MLKPLPKNLRAVLTATNDNYADDWRYLWGHTVYLEIFVSGEILPTNFKTYSTDYFCNLKGTCSWAWWSYHPVKILATRTLPPFQYFYIQKLFFCVSLKGCGDKACVLLFIVFAQSSSISHSAHTDPEWPHWDHNSSSTETGSCCHRRRTGEFHYLTSLLLACLLTILAFTRFIGKVCNHSQLWVVLQVCSSCLIVACGLDHKTTFADTVFNTG